MINNNNEASVDFNNYNKNIQLYDYNLWEFVHRSFALELISKSYIDLKDSVSENNKVFFETAVIHMIKELFPDFITCEIESNIKCKVKVDTRLLDLFTYEQYSKYVESKNEYYGDIFRSMGLLTLKNVLEYPINFDEKKVFSLIIKTDDTSRTLAESLMQFLIYLISKNHAKGEVCFRCADNEKGGQSFGKFITLISSNVLYGNGIYSGESNVSMLIHELNNIAENNFTLLKGEYKSVSDYNQLNNKKIPITVAVFCDVLNFSYAKANDELNKVLKNAKNSAINTIFLMKSNESSDIENMEGQINISFENNQAFLIEDSIKIPLDISNAKFTDEDFKLIEERMNAIEEINTDFKSHYDIENLHLFTRDATNGLSIPFAFDQDNNIVDLEIGDATPHALLSGSTGSGKSVTLHAIINQVMINYHPADVEIWAIDYKAVEFGYYVNKRTPHISVIGQDNSEDFTFGLIDLIKEEYDRRKDLFVKNNCKDFRSYRNKVGSRSLSRILIVVDEFHNMTQAISSYSGEKDYKKTLENLLSEMRAMGMSFLFCSQTIAAGLNGLTEKGRNQIGCRLSMRHEDITEIKETLSLSLSSGVDFESIKYLRQGELIYKKISNKPGTEPYTLQRVNVLYTEPYRDEIIDRINDFVEKDYVPRKEIICKNSNRYNVTEKSQHPISGFIANGITENYELLTVFPGAPTSLKDSFFFQLDEEVGNNILLVGEDDSMRESIIIHSILGMLIDVQNKIVVSILDTNDDDNQRLYKHLKKIKSKRIQVNYGYDSVMSCINELKKITPCKNGRVIYFWYGLNKLKNLIFINSQEDNDSENTCDTVSNVTPSITNPLDFLNSALSMIEESSGNSSNQNFKDNFDYSDCQKIIKNLEEYGSENNLYCFTIFNTVKGMIKSKIINVDNYDFRIGLKMSSDDSYTLFGNTAFVSKTNDTTAVFYSGSKNARTIRPYLIPNDEFFDDYNKRLEV